KDAGSASVWPSDCGEPIGLVLARRRPCVTYKQLGLAVIGSDFYCDRRRLGSHIAGLCILPVDPIHMATGQSRSMAGIGAWSGHLRIRTAFGLPRSSRAIAGRDVLLELFAPPRHRVSRSSADGRVAHQAQYEWFWYLAVRGTRKRSFLRGYHGLFHISPDAQSLRCIKRSRGVGAL